MYIASSLTYLAYLCVPTVLGASLYEVLTRIKAQPHLYIAIDITYSPSKPLIEPVILNIPSAGFRLRFDGPDQRLRLIEVYDFTRAQFSYKNVELIKPHGDISRGTTSTGLDDPNGPTFRHVYHRLMGPTFSGEYIPPNEGSDSQSGLYALSYPGIAFTFPLQNSAWSPKIDFVSLLSSNAASQAKSLAIFDGLSWQEARNEILTRPCPNLRSLTFSGRGKDLNPDEIELAKIYGNGRIEIIRRSTPPFLITLSRTTPQDLIAELGPPDAIYRKNDRRLAIHNNRPRDRKSSERRYSGSSTNYEGVLDTDQSSTQTVTDESDVGEDPDAAGEKSTDHSAECFYNYFHHGIDVLVSHPTPPSKPFPSSDNPGNIQTGVISTDCVVATKVLLHANVPGSYPFNRYRRCRWTIDAASSHKGVSLTSETPFADLSSSLQQIWRGSYSNESEEESWQRGMVLNRGWGDSPGSSCELLGGWEESIDAQNQSPMHAGTKPPPGSGNTELFGFPGLIFEVLRNDAVSCLTIY